MNVAAGGLRPPAPLDRKRFYDLVRSALFRGHLMQQQVDSINAILDRWEADYTTAPIQWLAYALATAYHETEGTMLPCEEIGRGRGKAYGAPDPRTGLCYYGRGFVQLTWIANYRRQAGRCGADFVSHPDLVMQPGYAAKILLDGMRDGDFTGRQFADFFNAGTNDPVQARRIVNGLDCAQRIAGYYNDFIDAL